MHFRVWWVLFFLPLFTYALTPTPIHEKYKEYFKTQKAITLYIDLDGMPLEAMENSKMIPEEIVTQTPQTKLDAIFRNVMLVLLAILLFILYHYRNSRKLNQKLQENLAIQIHDIRQKDKIIFHQNKLTSMGEMIQNIAHQWRQPLAQINSAIGVIDNRLYQNSVCDKIIEEKLIEIEKMTHYMSQTIDDFYGFLDENKQKESFNLYETIQKAIDITKGSLESCQIDIRLHLDKNITLVGYPNELLHIFVVLLSNAKDIIQMRQIANPIITVLLKRIDNFFEIYLCDNGGGIDSSIEEKIFEPYFSTKGKQQGRGLGLYISKMIMQESFGGDIRLQNSLKGACFIIQFHQD